MPSLIYRSRSLKFNIKMAPEKTAPTTRFFGADFTEVVAYYAAEEKDHEHCDRTTLTIGQSPRSGSANYGNQSASSGR